MDYELERQRMEEAGREAEELEYYEAEADAALAEAEAEQDVPVKIGINLMPKEKKLELPDYPVVVDKRHQDYREDMLESGWIWDPIADYGMWVGREFYPKKEDYIKEAAEMGCCKKVPGIPENVIMGDTRIFLVHKEAGKGKKAVVFGYFVLDGIVACTKLQEMIETVKKSLTGAREFPVTALTANERDIIPERGCGKIDPPSWYFVGPDDVTVQRGFRKSVSGSKTRIVLLPDIVIDYLGRFRGLIGAEKLFEFANLTK